jgi:hypothetical protein
LRGAQRLDLCAQLGVLVKKRAADPRALGDAGERDRHTLLVEFAQGVADALLSIERALGGGGGERAHGRFARH